MQLEIIYSSGIREKHPLEESRSYTVGRGKSTDFQVSEEGMSREHFRIDVTSEGVFVVDLQSANGVYINDERIEPNKKIEFPEFFPLIAGRNVRFSLIRLEDEDQDLDGIQNRFEKRLKDKRLEAASSTPDLNKIKISKTVKKKDKYKNIGNLAAIVVMLGLAAGGLYLYDPSFFGPITEDTKPPVQVKKTPKKPRKLAPKKVQVTPTQAVTQAPVVQEQRRVKKPRDLRTWIRLLNSDKCASDLAKELCRLAGLEWKQRDGVRILSGKIYFFFNIRDVAKALPALKRDDDVGDAARVLKYALTQGVLEKLKQENKEVHFTFYSKEEGKLTVYAGNVRIPLNSLQSFPYEVLGEALNQAAQGGDYSYFEEEIVPLINIQ